MAANKGSDGNAYGGRSKTFKKSKNDDQDDGEGSGGPAVLWSQNDRTVLVECCLSQQQRESLIDAIVYNDVDRDGSILLLTVNGYEFWKYRLSNPVKGSLQLTRSSSGSSVFVTLTKINTGEQWTSLGELLYEEEDYALSPSAERSLAYREIKFLKDDFYNKGGTVSYMAYVEDLRRESVHVTFNPSSFSFIFSTTCQKFLGMYQPATQSTVFYRHVRTKHNYDHSASSFKTTSRTIEITLVKHDTSSWNAVEAPAASESVVPASPAKLANEQRPLGKGGRSPASSPASTATSSSPTSSQMAPRSQPRATAGAATLTDDQSHDGQSRRQHVAGADGAGDALKSCNTTGGDFRGMLPNIAVHGEPDREQLYAGDGSSSGAKEPGSMFAVSSSGLPTAPLQPGKPMCVVQPLKDEDAVASSSGGPSATLGASSLPPSSTLHPFRGSRFTGLENLGNTCFMNAILQVLASTVEFRDYFLYGRFEQHINRDNPLGTGGRLALAFAELMRCLWKGDRPSYAPSKLKNVITSKAAQFTGYAQHDAQEFLGFLLDGLHEDLNKVKNKPYVPSVDGEDKCDEELSKEMWDAHKRRNDSVVVDAFQAQYKSKLVCPVCAKVSITFDPYMYLSVPLPRKKVQVPIYLSRRQPVSKPVKYVLALPEECTTDHVLRELSEKAGIPAAHLRLFEVHKRRFSKFYDGSMPFSATVGTEDHELFASEVLTREAAGERVLELRVTQWTAQPTETGTRCSSCRRVPSKLLRCTRCLRVGYCNAECQRKHWEVHRLQCKAGPELIGLPFIVSVQESRATYQCLAQMMEEYAQYSVNVFQPLQSKQAVSGSPTSLPDVTTASSEPSPPPCNLAGGFGGGSSSPGACRLGSSSRDLSKSADSVSCRSSSADDDDDTATAADFSSDPLATGLSQADKRGTVELDGAHSAMAPTAGGRRSDDTVADDLDDGDVSRHSGDVWLPADAEMSPPPLPAATASGVVLPDDGGDCGDAFGVPSLPASPCSPSSMLSSASEPALAASLPGFLAPSPSQTSCKDAGDDSTPLASPEDGNLGRGSRPQQQPLPTSQRSKPTRPVVGVAGSSSRRTFPFSIKHGSTAALTPAASAPLDDDGERPLRFVALNRASPHYLTMEWQNNRSCSDCYVLLNSKDLDHELDVSCTAITKDDFTLEQCLKLFTEPEHLTPEEAWYCPSCKQHREASKQLSLWSLPEILIIHLKRFSFQNFMWRDKMDKLVEYPIRGLDMSEYCVGPPHAKPQLYDLFGVVNHYGILIAGHYTAYARCFEDGSRAASYSSEQGWQLFDDSSVTHVAEKCVVSKDAYVLFYRKRKSSSAGSHSVPPPPPHLLPSATAHLGPDIRGSGDGRRAPGAGGDGGGNSALSSEWADDDELPATAAEAAAGSPPMFASSDGGGGGEPGGSRGCDYTDMNALD